ncbi:MAG TPA: biosynthetic-type acetolactate synthase large subunit [Firmicutes bacterium]|nr:biosynthetic-type acetolactate synthase large subunit [Bacillota bacterium]
MISGAKIMIECLEAEGVKTIFGYPGAAICPFYDALIDSSICHILVRQEQNAGHAASGYARISGRPGVCVVTSGPGATNLVTAIASAYMDSIPIVAITGQVQSELIGRDVFQEADITGACEPFTKHSYLVKRTEDLPRIFKEAFYIASTGRPGPVLIDVPVDIQTKEIKSYKYPETVDIIGYKPSLKGNGLQIKRACEAIVSSKRPVICAGGGVFSSKAEHVLMEFARKADIPVVNTLMGIGVLPSEERLCLGMLGTHGVKMANEAIQHADLLLLCGARVGDRSMASPNQVAKRTKIIHIDVDPAEIGKNMQANIPIVGDLKSVLEQMLERIDNLEHSEWIEKCREHKQQLCKAETEGEYIDPKRFMRLLSEKVDDNAVLVADVGQNQIWSANCFNVKNGRFLTSGGMGTMGYSVPASVGAWTAAPDRQVIAVCGDGSFQMQMMELGTIKQHSIKSKIIVMNNTKLGMVRELQDKNYGGRHSGVDLYGSPDFNLLAQAYGIPHCRISDMSEVAGAIDKMLSTDGPFLMECIVNPAESSLI